VAVARRMVRLFISGSPFDSRFDVSRKMIGNWPHKFKFGLL
jgi:hypothetical protein